MAVIKIQLHHEIRKYVDVNVQLSRIYNFIFKKFENVPSYFELQYRHPLNKIRRQLCDNDQLSALLSLQQNLTLLIRPITCENISRFQISRTAQPTISSNSTPQTLSNYNNTLNPFDICALLDNLSLQQNTSTNTTIMIQSSNATGSVLNSNYQPTQPRDEISLSLQLTNNNNYLQSTAIAEAGTTSAMIIDCLEADGKNEQTKILQDNSDYLIQDETTNEYIIEPMQLMTYDEEDRSAAQIEITFD